MTTARAVVIKAPGGPELLSVARREVPDPGPGEIRLAIRAAAVNPTDVVLREATEAVLREARGGIDVPPPWVPGMDAAGEVEAVGPGVERLAVGDQVMAAVSSLRPEGGAQCELIVVPEASAVPVPQGTSLVQAATLPMNGLTAILGLEQLALAPGQTIAVTGGAGLLASYVIPLAKERGLRVVADAKPEDEALVKGFGADLVVLRGDTSVSPYAALRRTASTRSTTPRCSTTPPYRPSARGARSRWCAAGKGCNRTASRCTKCGS